MLSVKKVELHAAVAKSLLGFFKDRLDERAAVLGYHFERGGIK